MHWADLVKRGDLVSVESPFWANVGKSSVLVREGSIGIVTSCETGSEFHVSVLFGERLVKKVYIPYIEVIGEASE